MKKDLVKSLESMLKSELVKEDSDSKYNNISTLMDTVETLKNSIELRNINLTGLTLLDEMNKAEEERKTDETISDKNPKSRNENK